MSHSSVLHVARAARDLIQSHPLATHTNSASNEQSSNIGDPYLVNLHGSQEIAAPSSAYTQSRLRRASSLISEDSFYKANQGYQAGGPLPGDSGGLPPDANLSSSVGVSEAAATHDISVPNGNLQAASAVPHNNSNDEDFAKYASIPGIATRNGGYEALAFPEGIFGVM